MQGKLYSEKATMHKPCTLYRKEMLKFLFRVKKIYNYILETFLDRGRSKLDLKGQELHQL